MFSVYADGQLIYFPLEEDLTIHTPKLTLEIGKAGSFQFGLPPTNRYYDRLSQLRTIITVHYDGEEIFRGRVLTINRGFNKIRQVYCEGDLAYLVDSVQKGEKYIGTTHDLFRRIVANHNARVEAHKQFVVGNITIPNRSIILAGTSEEIEDAETGAFDYNQIALNSMVDDWKTSFDFIENTIIDYCGGYLRTRRVGETTYLDLLADYGRTSIQRIDFGRNLIDLTEEVKAEDVFTVLIPLGDDNLTIASVNNGNDELVDAVGVSLFGRIVKTNVFDNVNDPNTLMENGLRMLSEHENMPITITVKAVDMHMLDGSGGKIRIGDRVYVNSAPHDITRYLTCTKIEYDLDNHANDTYVFGNPKQTMTQRYRKDKAKEEKKSKSHGSHGGGSAGGAAAGAAAEELETFAKEEGKRIDAWLNVDPDQGHINLGAFYEKWNADRMLFKNNVGIDLDAVAGTINIFADHTQYEKDRSTLKRKVGIDLDSPKGTVDIFSMNENINAQGKQIKKSEARIQTLADNDAAQIKQFADFKTATTKAYGELTIRATKTETTLSGYAKFIDTNKKNIENIAGIEAIANSTAASFRSYAKYIDDNRPWINSISQIQQTADEHGNSIDILSEYKNKYENDVKSIAEIKTTVDKDHTAIDETSTYVNDHMGDIEAVAGLKTWVEENRSEVQMSAEFRNKYTDDLEQYAGVKAQVQKNKETVEIVAGHVGEPGSGGLLDRVASIELISDAQGTAINLKADTVTVDSMILDAKKTLRAEFNEIVARKIAAEITDSARVFVKSLWCYGNCTVNDLDVYHNVNVSGTLYYGRKVVATQDWVNEQLKSYASSSHQHKYYVKHYHKIKIGSTTYSSEEQTYKASDTGRLTSGPV